MNKVTSFEVLEEHAFICTRHDGEFAEFRTYPIGEQTTDGADIQETFALDHFHPEYTTPFEVGSTGILHIIGVTYSDGDTQIVLANTVFPDARYRSDFNAGSIAHTELMLRSGELRFR